jgi:hypothetical protein
MPSTSATVASLINPTAASPIAVLVTLIPGFAAPAYSFRCGFSVSYEPKPDCRRLMARGGSCRNASSML